MVWSLCCEIMSGAVVFFFVVFLSLSFLPGGYFVVGFLCCGIIMVL